MPNSRENVPANGAAVDTALVREIAGLIVSALNLDLTQDEIDPAK